MAFVASATGDASAGQSATPSVVIPASAQAGDQLLVVLSSGAPTDTHSAGTSSFAQVGATQKTDQHVGSAWRKEAVAADAGRTATFSLNTSRFWSIAVLVYRGEAFNSVQTYNSVTAVSTYDVAAIASTAPAGSLRVAMVSTDNDDIAIGAPLAMTERARKENWTTATAAGTAVAAFEDAAGGGAMAKTGTLTSPAGLTLSDNVVCFTVLLVPTAAPAPVGFTGWGIPI